ncbi:hypothetical protein EW145_g2784 [Phellinidium pouzarii]|uniref:Golgi apyrase n=1 Tax=Phellinidium pouzarii TaxID=167371 RepID=A0A4V3XD43_9AGAM|nr:hypothetical protein EW145_g2784 [Phellinidium pouzarii]
MPPPTAVDEWLAGRRFGIVIDAGSSGSRLQIYSWRDARLVKLEEGPKAYRSLPKVERGTEDTEDWVYKVEPGISSFGENPDDVASYLAPLLRHAREHIPPSLESETPIFLLATAGMRLLPQSQQTAVLEAACDFFRFHSHFRVESVSDAGRCGSSIRVITGEEEGLFGWIAVNYLMDQFAKADDGQTTYGFLDMGGASTQIAFEPSERERRKSKNLIDVQLRLIGGEEIHHQVFVTTWLGYGTNQARERYVDEAISRYESTTDGYNTGAHGTIPDPCLPRDLQLSEVSAYPGYQDTHSKNIRTLLGTGSYEQCLKQVAPLLNKDAPCPDVPCPFNGVHVPHIDFSMLHFIGVSEYWYSSEHVFGLGGTYNFVEFEKAASEFCGRDWDDILRQHERSKELGRLGGDEDGGRIVNIGKWGNEVEIPRLQMQCFKSAWLVNVLHDGLGMPRIVDPDGSSAENSDEVDKKAHEKGLGKPIMQSLDTIGDTSISWTLGKMVLEASREIPSLSESVPLISDPALGKMPGQGNGASTVHSDSDLNLMHPSPHQFLGRYNLDFLSLGLFFNIACLTLILFIAYRIRHLIVNCTCRYLRRSARRGGTVMDDRISLEDGYYPNGGRFPMTGLFAILSLSSSASQCWLSMRSFSSRILAFYRPQTMSSPSSTLFDARHMHSPASRASPTRSFSSPSLRHQNGSAGMAQHAGVYLGSSVPPRSSTPPVYRRDSTQLNGHPNQSLYALPRSRNNSQMNLTMLVTRQPLSRSGSSGQQTPTMVFHEGE